MKKGRKRENYKNELNLNIHQLHDELYIYIKIKTEKIQEKREREINEITNNSNAFSYE